MIETNKIIQGDCLDVMRGMPDGCVDLIYADPPFGCQKEFYGEAGSFRDVWKWDEKCERFMKKEREAQTDLYFLLEHAKRNHSKGMAAYLIFMAERLIEMKRVLK